jgi:hypothetical protein
MRRQLGDEAGKHRLKPKPPPEPIPDVSWFGAEIPIGTI